MGASAQVFGGIIRGGLSYGKYGDPFEWSIAFISDLHNPERAILVGAMNEAVKHRQVIFQALKDVGFTQVAWERKKDDKSYWIEREL